MTQQEMERLLREKSDVPPRKNVAVVLSPQIVRTAAHLRKKRQDRLQMLLCGVFAALFLLACTAMWFFLRNTSAPTEMLKYISIFAGAGMLLFIICAPALILHEEE